MAAVAAWHRISLVRLGRTGMFANRYLISARLRPPVARAHGPFGPFCDGPVGPRSILAREEPGPAAAGYGVALTRGLVVARRPVAAPEPAGPVESPGTAELPQPAEAPRPFEP